MPIYEFACNDCHTLFDFYARRVNTETIPSCPKCGKPLSKQVSLFRAKSGSGTDRDPWGMANDGCDDDTASAPDFDTEDERIAGAIDELGSQIDRMDDTDSVGSAKLMQEFSRRSGVKFNKGVNEALNRMANGEDADAVAADLGDALNDGNPFADSSSGGGGTAGDSAPARYTKDPTLYEM